MEPHDKEPLPRRLGRGYGGMPPLGRAAVGAAGVLVALALISLVSRNVDLSGAGGGVVLLLVGVLYFLPAVIASRRSLPNKNSVFIVNLFFGWTFVGWVVALAWAVSGTPSQQYQALSSHEAEPGTASPPPSDIKQCPFCAEDIKKAAIVCKHCGRDLPAALQPRVPVPSGTQ